MRFGETLFCVMWTLSRGLTTEKSPVPTGAQNNQKYKEMTNYWAEHLASTNLNTLRKIRGRNDNSSQSASQSSLFLSVASETPTPTHRSN